MSGITMLYTLVTKGTRTYVQVSFPVEQLLVVEAALEPHVRFVRTDTEVDMDSARGSSRRYYCNVCGEDFPTLAHKQLHLQYCVMY